MVSSFVMNKSRRKAYWKLLLALAIIVGLYFVYSAVRDYYYEKHLAGILAALDAEEPGWDWEHRFAALPQLAKEENACEEIKAIMRLLALDEYRAQLGRNEWSIDYVRYESLQATERCKEFLRDHPNSLLIDDYRDNIRKYLTTGPCPEGLQRARQLKNYRGGLFPHRYRPILAMSGLPDVQPIRELVKLLGWNVALLAEANQPEAAVAEISNMLQLARAFDHDPFSICVLVRSAIVQFTCHSTHRLLAQTANPSPEVLKRLQYEFLHEESRMLSLPEMCRWERAIHDHDLRLLHSGEYSLSTYLEQYNSLYSSSVAITNWQWLDKLLKKAYPSIVLGVWAQPRHYAQERADQLEFFKRMIIWAKSPEHQLLDKFQAMKEQGPGVSPFVYRLNNAYGKPVREEYEKGSYLYLDGIVRAMLSYRANCRSIAVVLAAERYRLDHGAWPTVWEQLTPMYLPTALLDPFTGKPLILKQLVDGLMIYSVGYNRTDDGGKIFPVDKQYYGDIGYRLWNPERRRLDLSKEFKAIESQEDQ